MKRLDRRTAAETQAGVPPEQRHDLPQRARNEGRPSATAENAPGAPDDTRGTRGLQGRAQREAERQPKE